MMDLPCVQWQDHVAQKWIGLDPEIKEQFASQLKIDDVFKRALTLITHEDVMFLQSISADFSVEKDSAKAGKCRERGNSSFKTRDYTAAARHYTQGVCFALPCSEQLSLCYANRSAALYHLQHYQESLHDIEKAQKSGYPSHLLHKLEERRAQCLRHLSSAQIAKEVHHRPAFTVGICPQASVSFSLEKGRHLVATERIAAGEVILNDRPYSCILIPGLKEVKGRGARRDTESGVSFGTEHRRCHRCLAESLCPMPCEGCSYSRYCSASCRQVAWEEHHRWECALGADLKVMGVMLQLALRATLKAGLKNIQLVRDLITQQHKKANSSSVKSSESNPGHTLYHGDSYLSVFHLLHNLNRYSPGMIFLYAVTVATIYLKLSSSRPLPASWDLRGPSGANSQSPDEEGSNTDQSSELWLLGSTALRHMLQLRTNAQAIVMLQDTGSENSPVQASQEVCIATAIFPTLSVLNHSCSPNTSLVFSTGTTADPCASDLPAEITESLFEERSAVCGVTVTVRAAKDIAPGQEVLHCYGPHSRRMATQERQRLLNDQYYFLCQCEGCSVPMQQQQEEEEEGSEDKGQWSGLLCGKCKGALKRSLKDGRIAFKCSQPSCSHSMSLSAVSRSLQEIRADLEKAVDLMERQKPEKALKVLRSTQCHSALILAETQPLHGELEDALARAYATMGDWKNAASHLERSTVAIVHQYGEDSIELGHQLFKLAQLHFNGGDRVPALSAIAQVRPLLHLHCGPHSPELQELQAMEDCLRGEPHTGAEIIK